MTELPTRIPVMDESTARRRSPTDIASIMNLSNFLSIQDTVPLEIAVPLYGYVLPVVVMITVVTNSFIVLVLSQPQLRTPTNCILLAMAVTELLTGLISFPWMLYYYTFGGYLQDMNSGMPGFWCRTSHYFAELLPTVFHTSAIWLTVYLAIQRYWFVCSTSYRRSIVPSTSLVSLTRCRLAVGLICLAAILVELPIIFGKYQTPLYTKDYTFCVMRISQWVVEIGLNYFYNIYYWFLVIFVHAGPCTLLVIFGSLLIQTVRGAVKRRRESLGYLLRERDRPSNNSSSGSSNLHATTKMLVVVIIIFLLTEIPAAVIFTLHALSNTFSILPLDSYHSMNTALIFRNVFILISYPFNFAVYLSMSHQFRHTVRRIFCRQMSLFDTTTHTDQHRRHTHTTNPNDCVKSSFDCGRRGSLPLSTLVLLSDRRRFSLVENPLLRTRVIIDPPSRNCSVSLASSGRNENGDLPNCQSNGSFLATTNDTSGPGTRTTLSSVSQRNGRRDSVDSRKVSFNADHPV